MTDDDTRDESINGEGTPSFGGDIVGPGTGGTPTGAGTGEQPDGAAASDDPEVEQLIENLRSDGEDFRVSADEAAEQAGTGTDR